MLLVDLKRDKSPENRFISNTLLSAIEDSFNNKKKIILYINKRGDFSSLVCGKCGFLFQCDNCDISMSIHGNELICHLCGYKKPCQKKCTSCSSENLIKSGVGTGQIESYLKNKFNNKNIFRFDTDSIKTKKEKKEALDNIGYSDIIIGTKMISTGFDINNVGLIGIILLEQELQIPSYNTSENLFANLKQIIGRGGRKGEETKIIIQSYISENELIKNLVFSNYKDFLKLILSERKKFNYPPFFELVTLEYKNKDKNKSEQYISNLHKKINSINTNDNNIILLSNSSFKKNNQFHSKIIIKGENVRGLIDSIKNDILINQDLSVVFD